MNVACSCNPGPECLADLSKVNLCLIEQYEEILMKHVWHRNMRKLVHLLLMASGCNGLNLLCLSAGLLAGMAPNINIDAQEVVINMIQREGSSICKGSKQQLAYKWVMFNNMLNKSSVLWIEHTHQACTKGG